MIIFYFQKKCQLYICGVFWMNFFLEHILNEKCLWALSLALSN
jgi:hypothetical protein